MLLAKDAFPQLCCLRSPLPTVHVYHITSHTTGSGIRVCVGVLKTKQMSIAKLADCYFSSLRVAYSVVGCLLYIL